MAAEMAQLIAECFGVQHMETQIEVMISQPIWNDILTTVDNNNNNDDNNHDKNDNDELYNDHNYDNNFVIIIFINIIVAVVVIMLFRMNNIIQYISMVFTIIYMNIYWSSNKRPSHYYSNSIQLVPIVSFVLNPEQCTAFRLVDLIETEMSIFCCPFGKFGNHTYSTVINKYGDTQNYFDFIVSSICATFTRWYPLHIP